MIEAIFKKHSLAPSTARFGTLPGLPEAPSDPVAVDVGSRSIVLEWCPPVHDGGSQIVCYRLEVFILLFRCVG